MPGALTLVVGATPSMRTVTLPLAELPATSVAETVPALVPWNVALNVPHGAGLPSNVQVTLDSPDMKSLAVSVTEAVVPRHHPAFPVMPQDRVATVLGGVLSMPHEEGLRVNDPKATPSRGPSHRWHVLHKEVGFRPGLIVAFAFQNLANAANLSEDAAINWPPKLVHGFRQLA